MAWEGTEWACGHVGSMQLYGKMSGRDATVAFEAGRQCFACWLVGEWIKTSDPRAKRPDRFELAKKIAEGKGKRISGTEIIKEEVKINAKATIDDYPVCTA